MGSPSGGHVEADTLPHLFLSRRVARQAGHPAADGERGRSPLWLAGRQPLSSLLPTSILYTRDIPCQESKDKVSCLLTMALMHEKGVIEVEQCRSTTANFSLAERIEDKLDDMR